MCINFNGYHSGGSIFVNVNDCWLLQKLFVYHRYKFSLEKKKKIRSPSILFHTPKTVRIRQSGRIGIGGVTVAVVIILEIVTMVPSKIRKAIPIKGSYQIHRQPLARVSLNAN